MRKSGLSSIILMSFLLTVITAMLINYRLISRQDAEQPKIAIIKIKGEINSVLAEYVITSLEKINNNYFFKGIILEINSSGGSAYYSHLISRNILEIREKKFVLANIQSYGMSGAYLIASAASYVIASDISEIGSIGVMRALKILDSKNAKIKIFTSGKYKVIFNDTLNEKIFGAMQDIVDRDYEKMLELIAKGRRIDIDKARKAVGESRIYLAPDAKEQGLIDEIMPNNSTPKVVQRFLEKLNLFTAEVVEFKNK